MERFKLNFRENPNAKNTAAFKRAFVKAGLNRGARVNSPLRINTINKDLLVKKINAVADIINQDNTVVISKEKQEEINLIIEK